MSFNKRQKKHRPYQIKKRGIKDDFIDKQITVIHQAIVEKLLANPNLVEKVQRRLDEKREQGTITYSAYITWTSILELYDDPKVFKAGVLEDSQRMRTLRRTTPFVGILTEQERQKALEEHAIGKINHIDVLF